MKESLKDKVNKKFGFWGFCAVAAGSIAAVKITEKVINNKMQEFPSDEELASGKYDEKPCTYVICKGDLRTVAKCRRKIMELMDLYECCSEAEILHCMGWEIDEEDLDHKIFDSTTKFKVRYRDGEYVLYSQAPREVMEEAENGEHIGDEDSTEDSVSGS